MSRDALIRSSVLPYHVTSRSNNRDWFYLRPQDIWRIFCEAFTNASDLYGARLHSLVVMMNHFHALITTPEHDLGEVMRYVLTEVSREISSQSKRMNHVFGSRYKWSLLEDAEALAYVYKYIFRNPVRAGVCERVEDYQYSTLGRLMKREFCCPLTEGLDGVWSRIPKPLEERLEWLNMPTPKEQEEVIKLALWRRTFQFSGAPSTKRLVKRLQQTYLPPPTPTK